MSSLGIDQSLLSSPPANSSLTVPTAIGRGSRIPLLLAASDWMTATPAMYGVLLEHSSRGRHVLSSLLVSACIAALVVVLQVNDGAYRGDSGPLRIREVEHTIRAGAQASLLILLVSLMLGDVSLRGAVELSVCAAVSALVIEKLLLAGHSRPWHASAGTDIGQSGTSIDSALSAAKTYRQPVRSAKGGRRQRAVDMS